jgi:ribosomal protein S18 acetylase RimI-like enzyme
VGHDDGLVAAGVENLVAWHEACVHALGWPSRRGPRWWTRPADQPSIYFTAIQLAPSDDAELATELGGHLESRAHQPEAVCCTHADLDLSSFGLTVQNEGRWFGRAAAAPRPPDKSPRGLEIRPVTTREELIAFEATSETAFSSPPPAPGRVYGAGLLDDPSMLVLLGLVDDEPVAGAMAYSAAGVIGIYSVGTVRSFRERGYASALTVAALASAGSRPAILQPSLAAARLYRRLGFVEVGRFSHWGHSAPSAPGP